MKNYLLIAILFGGFISLWGNDAVKVASFLGQAHASANDCKGFQSCTNDQDCTNLSDCEQGCCGPWQASRKKKALEKKH